MSSMLATLLADAGGGGRISELPSDADPDTRIRARLQACRDGMAQLDALREKHEKLMQAMRFRIPPESITTMSRRKSIIDKDNDDHGCYDSLQVKRAAETLLIPVTDVHRTNNASSISPPQGSSRSDSPPCFSHRSSVSIDSGCGVSISSQKDEPNNNHIINNNNIFDQQDRHSPNSGVAPMPYATYRKISMEGRVGGVGGLSIEERKRLFEHSEPINDERACYRPPRPPRGESTRRLSLHDMEEKKEIGGNEPFHIVASTIESTTTMRAPSMRRIGRMERPRSMFEKREEESTRGAIRQEEAYRNSTLERSFTRDSALIDSMSFSQITPPPVQRKFGIATVHQTPNISSVPVTMTVNKTPPTTAATVSPPKTSGVVIRGSPPVPKPRSNSSSSHVVPLKTPIKAEITPPRNVQRAHQMISGVFTATKISDASRTPPTRTRMSRPLSLHEIRVEITPDEEITGIFHARPAKVLSRQSSSSNSSISSSSPPGHRKNGVVQAPRLIAFNNSQMKRSESSSASITSSRGRLQKLWRESEGL